jgi:hypothetical protein
MKLALSLAVVLGLALVSQAAIVAIGASGNTSIDVSIDNSTPPDTGLTAYIVTLISPVGIYSVDGRIDATTGYLNQEWYKGTKQTPIEDPDGQWGNLTEQQVNDDTNIMLDPDDMVTDRAPQENLIAGTTNGNWLAYSATQTMAFGFSDQDNDLNYNSIPFARIVLAAGAVADFNFHISDGLKDNDAFNFNIGAVPEPMTLSLVAVGALALIRRRR